MRTLFLLTLLLTAFLIVDAGRRGKGKKYKAVGCTAKTLKKAIKMYDSCLRKGFKSILGCEHKISVKKPLSKGKVKKCEKIERKADACGHSCPTDGGWSPFSEWSDCSAACAGGDQFRTRTCTDPAPAFGGELCLGEDIESQDCNLAPCSVDGEWSEFGNWSDCSAECGGGSQFRLRDCDNPTPADGGADCEGGDTETKDCNTQHCPVDGNWSEFGDWSSCSANCGGGKQYRLRNCNNPAPKYSGAECEGVDSETADCNTTPCPVDGDWSSFGSWSECSVECGSGFQSRARSCDKPAPAYGGVDCEGFDAEIQNCNTVPCPVDGHWSPFGEWSGCTAECGGGSRMRIRACDRPAPAFGGADCKGESSLTIACNTQQCPVTYEFQHRTSARGKWDGGAFSGYFYTVIGTLGETAEHDCEADRELGGTDSCVIKDFTDIGDIKGLRIRNSGDNTWRFVKIAVTIDGVYGGTYEGYTSVDDYATVTVHIMSDPANPDCGRKSLGCWADSPAGRAVEGGIRFHSDNPIDDCERYAQERGFSVFAVQYGHECFTAANAEDTFKKFGDSKECSDGTGGSWSSNVYFADTCKPSYECGRQSLGCWKDTLNRAIEGGIRLNSDNPVKDCEQLANDEGFLVFAVQFGTECFTAINADQTYQMYGPAENCKDGRGGYWAQSVYKTGSCPETPECGRKNLGCWRDDPLRSIQGGIRLTSDNPVEDCEKYAVENGYAVFAVQDGRECFTADNASNMYQMYGPSEKCVDGKGGTWAQNVYKAGDC